MRNLQKYNHLFILTAERRDNAGREHSRQRRHQGGLPGLRRVGSAQRARASATWPRLHASADVLDQCSQHLVCQGARGDAQARHTHGRAQSR